MDPLCKIVGVTFFVLLAALGCDDDGPPGGVPRTRALEFTFLDGSIGANLMPIVPPDPISATVVVEVSNPTSDSISDVTLPWADVFEVGLADKLGRVELTTPWDGRLTPGEKDTVTVTKINSGTRPFDPPCTRQVYLRITAEHSGKEISVFQTDTLTFECVH